MNNRQAVTLRVLVGAMILMLPYAARSQQSKAPANSSSTLPMNQSSSFPSTESQPTDLPPDIAERQAKLVNAARQKQLVLDTQKLLTLANDLKAAVDKSNKDTLSLDVIRKADEIEKLAHSVKEKMKGN